MTWEQTIEEAKDIAYQKGLDEGVAQGLEQGIAQGVAQGANENAIENAKNALAMGLSHEQVVQITGLPIETVLEISHTI